METLQMQLRPHFLFNALNAIAMLVRRDRKQEAVDVIVGFSELLRYVLDESGTLDVSLNEELGFVRRYLDIERIRIGDRLAVRVDIEPGTGGALVPNLILQPLVENALKHGIVGRPEGGTLWIRAQRRGSRLRLEVEDDGPGLPQEFSLGRTRGVGLRNLQERLEVFSSGTGKLSLASPGSGGTLAAIEIPYREDTRSAELTKPPELVRAG